MPKGQRDGIQILGEREVGKFRPKAWDIRREATLVGVEEERSSLRKLALIEATLSHRRDTIARKMYHGEPLTLEDWPTLMPLTAAERTRIFADVRHGFGLRADGKKL